MKFLKFLFRLALFVVFTAVTQIGGIVYLFTLLFFGNMKLGKYILCFGIYLICTYFVVPKVAPYFGRERLISSELIASQSLFYRITNRNYVRPEMNLLLSDIASEFNKKYPKAKIVCLDANFPFINKFPLLPHLSHDDGKKLDISLMYELEGLLTNKKPSVSGYGIFEGPKRGEYNQINKCKAKGDWQYDIQKYMTLGVVNEDLKFSEKGTKTLLNAILKQPSVGKVFIEPHLKHRLGLQHEKIRFHGCKAVRHDDHIHLELK